MHFDNQKLGLRINTVKLTVKKRPLLRDGSRDYDTFGKKLFITWRIMIFFFFLFGEIFIAEKTVASIVESKGSITFPHINM